MKTKCSMILSEPQDQPMFTGCDGKLWDDDFIKFHLKEAVEEENYEFANECKLELERRAKKKTK